MMIIMESAGERHSSASLEVYCMTVTLFYAVTNSQVTHKVKWSELCKPSKALSSQGQKTQAKQPTSHRLSERKEFCHRQ